MLILTENTPNPDALKFLPDTIIAGASQIHFTDKSQAELKSSLAAKLFDIEGVNAVFLGSDFITITKDPLQDWIHMRPEILMVIMDHLTLNIPIFDSTSDQPVERDISSLSKIEQQIIEIIETRVRPSVAMDGGDIVYRGFEDGIVKLELYGSCSGCPSSSITLKNGIETMLQHFVPEVLGVEAVSS